MNGSDGMKALSQQETHSASNNVCASRQCGALPASVTEHHWWGESAQRVLLSKHRVLDIPDIPSCDIFFSLDSLMSLPAWVIACTKEHMWIWRGARGAVKGESSSEGHPEAKYPDADMKPTRSLK